MLPPRDGVSWGKVKDTCRQESALIMDRLIPILTPPPPLISRWTVPLIKDIVLAPSAGGLGLQAPNVHSGEKRSHSLYQGHFQTIL
jgi:hypothetical protein